MSRFSIEIFLSPMPRNFLGGPFCAVFQKISGSEKNYGEEGGGGEVSRFSFEKILSHSAEKFRKGTFQGVTNLGCRKISCFRGLCHDHLSNFFCLTVPKHFVGEPLSAVFQKNYGSEKVYG